MLASHLGFIFERSSSKARKITNIPALLLFKSKSELNAMLSAIKREVISGTMIRDNVNKTFLRKYKKTFLYMFKQKQIKMQESC
jgi:hypothetical protein